MDSNVSKGHIVSVLKAVVMEKYLFGSGGEKIPHVNGE